MESCHICYREISHTYTCGESLFIDFLVEGSFSMMNDIMND